jgi:hypothetical protein
MCFSLQVGDLSTLDADTLTTLTTLFESVDLERALPSAPEGEDENDFRSARRARLSSLLKSLKEALHNKLPPLPVLKWPTTHQETRQLLGEFLRHPSMVTKLRNLESSLTEYVFVENSVDCVWREEIVAQVTKVSQNPDSSHGWGGAFELFGFAQFVQVSCSSLSRLI